MQGQRRTIGSFPTIVNMMQGPSSNGTDMNHQSSLNHAQNAVDFRLSDYRGSSGETACLRGTGPNVSFNGWNTGEPSSGLNLVNQVNDDGLKSEQRLSSSCSAIAEDGLRPEERQLLGNQSRIHPSFLQGSSSNHTSQGINFGMEHIANSSDRGKGKETGNGVNNNDPFGLDREKTSIGSSSFNQIGASSASSGYMAWGDSGSSSSSLANWGPSCKRKTLEDSSMQLCTGGSSSSLVQSENGYWLTDSVDLNVPGSLGDLSPLEDFRVTSPPFQQNTRNEARQEASNAFPSMVSIAENVERPLRNFDRRMTHLHHPESVPLNLTSTGSARHHNYPSPHQIPSSLSFNESLDLRLAAGAAGVTAANSAVTQNQSPSLHMHPFPWNRAANPRVARSSSSYSSGERAVRDDFNLRIFPRDGTEHPMNMPASSGHEPAGWYASSSNVNNAGGIPPPSWIGSSSNVHSLPNPSWTFNHEVPSENLQRVSEFSPWSLFPSISSASGTHNGHSSSTSGPPSFSQGSSSNQPHPRPSFMTERRGGDVLSAPHSLRTLPFDNEGRRRLISEIRQVLLAMRRGENLRAEDYMLFDPFLYHGMAEMHDRHREMRLDVDNMSYEELLALEERIGDVSTGLSEDIINKLMKQRFYMSLMTESSSDLEPCCICQEEYVDGQNLGLLDCGFKQGINDTLGRISTWSTENDCCAWQGVHCDNITRRVTKIDLTPNFEDEPVRYLKGEMNLCILELEFLSYLDLSDNEFDVIRIPSIQHNITHSSKLVYLDLSTSYSYNLHMDNLDWLSPLSSLKYLYLIGIDLHKETNWLQIVNTLPSLLELHLNECNLNNFPSVEYLNLFSIVTLALSDNNFTSHIPDGFFNLTKYLTYLYLSESHIHGEIPSSLLNLQNLTDLYLSYNQLQGSVPEEIGQLAHIQHLDLSENQLQGSIPSTLGNLSSLNSLWIGSNNFSGEISNLHFSKLSSLDHLDMSNSNFVFQFDLDWVPPFQLHSLSLSNTTQGPHFPFWIYTQKSLQYLDLSSSGISLVDRNKFSSLIERITGQLILSNNSIAEDISILTLNCSDIRLDHNNFIGGLPNISPIAGYVDLSYNSFSGSIPQSWKNLEELVVLNLWSNRLSGEVPEHLSASKPLRFLNLGENEFSGTIPIMMSQYLEVVILRANQFEGTIPQQLFNLSNLFHLDLAHNKFSGSLPHCVYNLTHMVTYHLDVYDDTTVDLFTKGQDYVYHVKPYRRTIDLSANHLTGEVPLELFRLVQVQSLNLSHNSFIGTIPKKIGGMKNMESLDLSNNKFCGEIPQSMSVLTFLGYLNLSYNSFEGKIPVGTQLQSFNASSYIGNPKLCGAPLNNCTMKEENPKTATSSTDNEDDDSLRESLYLGMGVGFAVGFWGICGSLFLIRKWRHAYFRFIYGVGDKLYVALTVKLNSFRRN